MTADDQSRLSVSTPWSAYWPLMRPVWDSPKRGQVIGLLLLAVSTSVISSGFLVWESLQRGEFISALAARNGARFQQATWRAC